MRRIVPLLLVLMALLPSIANAALLTRCEMPPTKGACCCPAMERDPGEGIRRARCCDTGEREMIAAGDAVRIPDGPTAGALVLVALVAPSSARPAGVVAARHEVNPSRGPPDSLLARRCALLL